MRHRKPSFHGPTGTVSHGTLRSEDLLPAFLSECEDLRLTKSERNQVRSISAAVAKAERQNESLRATTQEKAERYWQEDASEDCNTLQDILSNHAAPFCYFGNTEGDGSDFGWWVSRECLEMGVYDGEVLLESSNGSKDAYSCGRIRGAESAKEAMREVPARNVRYRMVINDHGNVTLYDRRNGREVWGIV